MLVNHRGPKALPHRLLPCVLLCGLVFVLAAGEGIAQERQSQADLTSTLTGRVMSAMTGGPLEDARVVLQNSGRGSITDSTGKFTIADVPPGRESVEVSLIGFAEERVALDLQPGATMEVTFLLSETVLRVEEINVLVQRKSSEKIAGFEERRSRGTGHYITPAEIESRSPQHSSDLLRMVPGVEIGPRRQGRSRIRMSRARMNCPPTLFVDGVRQRHMHLDDINRGDIWALEVYTGTSQIPAEFSYQRSGCGVLVVWTRDGLDIE